MVFKISSRLLIIVIALILIATFGDLIPSENGLDADLISERNDQESIIRGTVKEELALDSSISQDESENTKGVIPPNIDTIVPQNNSEQIEEVRHEETTPSIDSTFSQIQIENDDPKINAEINENKTAPEPNNESFSSESRNTDDQIDSDDTDGVNLSSLKDFEEASNEIESESPIPTSRIDDQTSFEEGLEDNQGGENPSFTSPERVNGENNILPDTRTIEQEINDGEKEDAADDQDAVMKVSTSENDSPTNDDSDANIEDELYEKENYPEEEEILQSDSTLPDHDEDMVNNFSIDHNNIEKEGAVDDLDGTTENDVTSAIDNAEENSSSATLDLDANSFNTVSEDILSDGVESYQEVSQQEGDKTLQNESTLLKDDEHVTYDPSIGYTSIWGKMRQKPLEQKFLDEFLERDLDENSDLLLEKNSTTKLMMRNRASETNSEDSDFHDRQEKEAAKLSNSANTEFVEGLDDIDKFMEEVEPPDELDVGAAGSSMQDVLIGQIAQILKKKIEIVISYIKKSFKKSFTALPHIKAFFSSRRNEDGTFVLLRKHEIQRLWQQLCSNLIALLKNIASFLKKILLEDEDSIEYDFDFSNEESKLESIKNRFTKVL